mgnify:CR=1 FL=1
MTDASQLAELNGAVGFSRDDVSRAIVECTGYKARSKEHAAIVATLTRWCDGYLFADGLKAADGMFQSFMVVQVLAAVKEQHRGELLGFLARWAPAVPLEAEPEASLMEYYAHSAALLPQLQRLTGPGLTIPAPALGALSVATRVATATTKSVDDTREAATIVRTLYHQGLLTHAAATPKRAGADRSPYVCRTTTCSAASSPAPPTFCARTTPSWPLRTS